MTKPFDPTKPVQTRDGHSVRILCTDRLGYKTPIIGLINQNSHETVYMWTKDGRSHFDSFKEETNFDLVNVPVKKSGWINLWNFTDVKGLPIPTKIYETKEEALLKRTSLPNVRYYNDPIEIHWEE